MKRNTFYEVSAREHNPNYEKLIKRENPMFQSQTELRTPFERDTPVFYILPRSED